MTTLKLKVSDKILGKVIWLLNQFNTAELEIIEGNEAFQKNQAYLKGELSRVDEGKAKYYSINGVDELLSKTIAKNED
ncbi:MAG: hypothetical protein JKY53_10305 [Flavobacteriales bacterium]|nr:hypothetical protein [Flavobacteriales bacterium]